MNIELKPCPFCGGEAEMMGDQYPYAECQECAGGFTANHSYEFDENDAASKWNARSAAGPNLKPIAEKKVRQLGGDVCGVLVRNEAGAIAAVSDMGRVTWLDDCVLHGNCKRQCVLPDQQPEDKEDALDCALSGQSYTERLIQSVCDELNAMAFDLTASHTVDGQWPVSEKDTAMKVDHLRRMASELHKLQIVPLPGVNFGTIGYVDQAARQAPASGEVEPDWSDSKTLDSEGWKNPLLSKNDRLQIADGAVAWRDEVIKNLRSRDTHPPAKVPEDVSNRLASWSRALTGWPKNTVPGSVKSQIDKLLTSPAPAATPQPAQQGSVPDGITVEMLDAIWQAGIDAENYDDRDFCDPLIRARIAIEESETPQPEGDTSKVPEEYRQALQDAYDIIIADANTPENYGSLCRIGNVLSLMSGNPQPPIEQEAKVMAVNGEYVAEIQAESQRLHQQLTTAQAENEALRARVAELDEVCANIHRDLLLRAEPDWDDSDVKVVNLSAGYWDDLCRVVDAAQRLRDRANEIDGGGQCPAHFMLACISTTRCE